LAHVDFSHVKEIVGHLSLPLLAAGAMALLATSPFGALRWHIVLAAETTSPGSWTLLKIVLVGLFFNQILPSGGDAVRAWRCHRLGIGAGAAIRSLAGCGKSRDFGKTVMKRARNGNSDLIKSMSYEGAKGDELGWKHHRPTFSAAC
jgi:hypothetical protein